MTNKAENLPLVTAVIPTRNRPDLVCRAVRSALAQTYPNLEVVVVVDGPDPATVAALEAFKDSRVRVAGLSQGVGGSEARNIGAREAKGDWVALLDDDDEWMPTKIAKQLNASRGAGSDVVFLATQYVDRQNEKEVIRPTHFPTCSRHISEFLFCDLDWRRRRTTFLQTSTWMVFRRFLLSHPFTPGLRKNQDTDWLLRWFPEIADRAAFVSDPLSTFDSFQEIRRVSTSTDWRYSFRWAMENRSLFTARGFSFFLALVCGRDIALQSAGLQALISLWRLCAIRERLCFPLQTLFLKRGLQCLAAACQFQRERSVSTLA